METHKRGNSGRRLSASIFFFFIGHRFRYRTKKEKETRNTIIGELDSPYASMSNGTLRTLGEFFAHKQSSKNQIKKNCGMYLFFIYSGVA